MEGSHKKRKPGMGVRQMRDKDAKAGQQMPFTTVSLCQPIHL